MFVISPGINVLLELDLLILFFLTFSLNTTRKILLYWNSSATTEHQYSLEKNSYLVATILKFSFFLQLVIFPYFLHVMDQLSSKLPGAMCATGVFNSSDYGFLLLALKILLLFGFSYWLILHHFDLGSPNLPYTKLKYQVYALLFLIFLLSVLVEVLMFQGLDPKRVTTCCSSLFGNVIGQEGTFTSWLTPAKTWPWLYVSFALLLLSYLKKWPVITVIFNLFFLGSAIISLVYFFSPYIYQTPTHQCPFCLLQSDYNYTGYLLYILLFSGVFSGLMYPLLPRQAVKNAPRFKQLNILLLSGYLIWISMYPVLYWGQNGVGLWPE